MSVEISIQGECMTARIRGDLDHHSCTQIRAQIDAHLERHTPSLLILDMEGVPFMDSSGIGLIMGRMRVQRSCGGNLALKNTNLYLTKIITLAGLSSLIIDKKHEEERVK